MWALGSPPPRWMDLGPRRVVVRTLRPGAPACSGGVGGPGRVGEVPARVGDPRRGCRPGFGCLGAGLGAAASRARHCDSVQSAGLMKTRSPAIVL